MTQILMPQANKNGLSPLFLLRLLTAVLLLLASAPVKAQEAITLPYNVTLNGTACHLRDAIAAANSDTATGNCPAGSGADTITLTANVTLAAELPDVTSVITIAGSGHTISGNSTYQIFEVRRTGNLTINYSTLSNGAAYKGGAIRNRDGTLTIRNSTLSGNSSESDGAAIFNDDGKLTIRNSTFSSNSSAKDGGAIDSTGDSSVTITNSAFNNNSSAWDGGAIEQRGGRSTMTITNSTFSGNSTTRSGYGGAIYNVFGQLTIRNSTFSGNSSTYDGGAIASGGDSLTISNSSFRGNSGQEGGAIFSYDDDFAITNSTISGNTASTNGGGIYLKQSRTATLKHVTIINNSAPGGGGIYRRNSVRALNILNSIIAGSTNGGDCVGGVNQNISNLIQDNSCSPALSGDPKLGTLTGSPAYFPLVSDSPAVNAANAAHCASTDQAGNSRPYPSGGRCDIGAFELQAAAATDTPASTATNTATSTDTPTSTATNTATATDSPTSTATNTATATDTPTSTATNTATATDTPVPSEFCVRVGPGVYWLFPADRFLSGRIEVYTGVTCDDTEVTEASIGANGYVYTYGSQDAAASLCADGHNSSSVWTAAQQAFNGDVWQCSPFSTNTPLPTDTPVTPSKTPTNTPLPSDTPVTPSKTPTNTPLPTNTPVTPSKTPTNTPLPTNTPVTPSKTPTNTPLPSDTPVTPSKTPTNTPLPTNTPVTPTNTPVPASAPQIDSDLLAVIDGKIVHHRDVTGRSDLVAGFRAARAGLTGEISAADALAAIDPGWSNDLWNRIRSILQQM